MSTLPKELLHFFAKQPFMTISTCQSDQSSFSHTSVLLFIFEKDHFYFATHEASRKVRGLFANPHVSGVIWTPNEMNVQWQGIAERVKGADWIFEKLIHKAGLEPGFWPPIFKYQDTESAVFKIKPIFMTVMQLDSKTISSAEPPMKVVLDITENMATKKKK